MRDLKYRIKVLFLIHFLFTLQFSINWSNTEMISHPSIDPKIYLSEIFGFLDVCSTQISILSIFIKL